MMNLNRAFLNFAVAFAMTCSLPAFAETAPTGQPILTPDGKPVPPDKPIGYKGDDVPLFFRETWKIPPVSHDGAVQQRHVSSPNLELKLYGSSKDIDPSRGSEQGIQANGGPGLPGTGHLFTGLCERPCAMALRDKSHFVDLSGFGKIRWSTRVTGLHQLHPIVKLADGTWLLGEHSDGTVGDYHPTEFGLAETRWIKMDMDKVVTRGRWLDKVDLSRVDEIGFADLMPGSGHDDGGYSNLDFFEVYGKTLPR
jgi:hypothetical protein